MTTALHLLLLFVVVVEVIFNFAETSIAMAAVHDN